MGKIRGLGRLFGKVIRENSTYTVIDNSSLERLNVSETILNPMECTAGHFHGDSEEVYVFLEGFGMLELNEEKIEVFGGNIVSIPAGAFHKVHNSSSHAPLVFISIFEKYGDRQ